MPNLNTSIVVCACLLASMLPKAKGDDWDQKQQLASADRSKSADRS
jgi:hypothetical protein